MARRKFSGANAELANAEVETFAPYDGPPVPNGVYRGVLRRLKVKGPNKNGDDMLNGVIEIREPKRKNGAANPKAKFNGATAWLNNNINEQGAGYINNTLKGLGCSQKDIRTFWGPGVVTNDDDFITKIGVRKFDPDGECPVIASLGKGKPYQGETKLEVKSLLVAVDDGDDADVEDDELDDEVESDEDEDVEDDEDEDEDEDSEDDEDSDDEDDADEDDSNEDEDDEDDEDDTDEDSDEDDEDSDEDDLDEEEDDEDEDDLDDENENEPEEPPAKPARRTRATTAKAAPVKTPAKAAPKTAAKPAAKTTAKPAAKAAGARTTAKAATTAAKKPPARRGAGAKKTPF